MCNDFVSQLKNPELRRPQTFRMSRKQTCPTFATDADIISNILDSKQIYPLPQRETLPSKAVGSTTLKRKFKNKWQLAPLLTRDPWIISSQ